MCFLPVIYSAVICTEFHLPSYHQLLGIVRFFFKFVLFFTLLNSFISKLYRLVTHLLFQILYFIPLAAQSSGEILQRAPGTETVTYSGLPINKMCLIVLGSSSYPSNSVSLGALMRGLKKPLCTISLGSLLPSCLFSL